MSDSEPEYKNSDAEDYRASEYVKMEADFFSDSHSNRASEEIDKTSSHPKAILVISLPHQELNEIVSELQKNLGYKVMVLSASDYQSVQDILNSQKI